jgi:signal transduction histidine kinase
VETRLERLNELPDINPILDKVVAATELANTIIKAVQRIAAELRPGVLDRLGLATALRYEAARFEERTHIPCRLEETTQDPDVADEVKTALFRIFQESLTNVARHAAAGKVAIRFEKHGTDWLLEVRDDGRGIPPEAVGGVTSLGLLGMRERARLVGGEVTVTRAEPRGTVVTVRVPVGAPAPLNRS